MVAQSSAGLAVPATINDAENIELVCTLCGLPASRGITDTVEDVEQAFCCYACRYIYHIVAPDVVAGMALPVAIGKAGLDLNAPCCRGIIHGDPTEVANNTLSRLLLNAFLGMMVMVLSLALYSDFFFAEWGELGQGVRSILQTLMMLFATPAILLLALPILEDAILTFQARQQLTTSALIAVGSLAAYGLSVYATFIGQGHTYYETATMTLLLVTLGRWLDAKTHVESTKALDTLLARTPDEASLVLANGDEIPTNVEKLRIGDHIRVRPGESLAVDGLIISGQGSINEANITGESASVYKQLSDQVYAGTVSIDGSFVIEATQVGEDRVMGKLVRLLDEARLQRAPIERLADRVSAYFVPIVISLALGTLIFWTWQVSFEQGLLTALAVLLIACPCALGIATPLAIWAALGRAAQAGVLIRDSITLEKLARIRKVFFDKTGTLTTGQPMLSTVIPANGLTNVEILQRAASLEFLSEHPVAQAFLNAATEQALPYLPVENFRAIPGMGITGKINNETITLGSWRLVEQQALTASPEILAESLQIEARGMTVIYIGWAGQVQGIFGMVETVRSGSRQILDVMQANGLQIQVLTGDSKAAGDALSQRLGVAVQSCLLPHEKVIFIEDAELRGPVTMVGDGLNDAPALSRASVGIALGCGADVTREAADVSLLGNDLSQIGWTLALARQTYRTIHWNLIWAFAYNIIGIGLAIAGLLHPVLAAVAMVISSAMVVFNSLRVMPGDDVRE